MKDEDENEAAAEPAPPGKSKVLPLLLVVNTLLLTGVLIFVMKRPAAQAAPGGEKGGHEAAATAGGPQVDTSAPGPTLRFDNFTIQLKSAEVDRYAHLAIEMEVADDATKAVVEKRVAPIRDLIIGYLTDRTAEELRGSDGLKQMKDSLLKKLEQMVPGHRIRALYITNFIIQ